MTSLERHPRHERVHIQQEIKWIDLETERAFLEDKANFSVTDPTHLGPIIRKRLEWLDIQIQCCASYASPTVSPAASPPASHTVDPIASPSPLPSPAVGRSAARRQASSSPRQSVSPRPTKRAKRSTPDPRSSPSEQTPLGPFVNPKDCGSSFKPSGAGSEPRRALVPLKPPASSKYFLEDVSERITASLISLELPADDIQRMAIEALRDELLKAITVARSHGDGSDLAGIAKTFYHFLIADTARRNREVVIATWCQVCNHAWAFLREYLSQSQSQVSGFSLDTVACPGDGDDDQHLLFHNTPNWSILTDTTDEETWPGIQCMQEAQVPVPADAQETDHRVYSDDSNHQIGLASQEIEPEPHEDLGLRLTGRVLLNMHKCFEYQEGLTRTFHLTVAGSRVRLYMADAISVSTSRAYDAMEQDDALGIAQLLAFMCSTSEQVAPSWKPSKGMVLQSDYPSVTDANGQLLCSSAKTRRYFCIVSEVQFEPQPLAGRLWGRHTACWFAEALEIKDLAAAASDSDDPVPPDKLIPLVLKGGWIPCYLRNHEYEMLRILHRDEREDAPLPHENDFPWALGVVDLSQLPISAPISTARLPEIPPSEAERLEADHQTTFVVLAQKCPRGLSVLDTAPAGCKKWTVPQQLRILRDLLRLLKRVSMKGIHYRDINLGNFALKPGFEALMSNSEQSVLILFDFGNSRYLDDHRGGERHPRSRGIKLGVDDALSVNANFLSHRSLLCMRHLEKAAQHHSDGSEASFRRAEEKFWQAQRLEHRFIDDCDSAIWAFLRLVQAWCSDGGRTVLEALFAEAEGPDSRARIWQQDFVSEIGHVEKHLAEFEKHDWTDILGKLNKIIWDCQKQLHQSTLFNRLLATLRGSQAPEQLLRGPISPRELEAFDKCDETLNAFLGFGEVFDPIGML